MSDEEILLFQLYNIVKYTTEHPENEQDNDDTLANDEE